MEPVIQQKHKQKKKQEETTLY